MRYQSHAHPNDSRQTTLQAETPGDAAPENAAPGDAALLGAASSAGPARTSVQLWAVWFTLLVSVSGGALELLGGGVTAVGWALGLVALIDVVLLALPGREQARWLPLTPYFYGGMLLGAWLAAFYLLYPRPPAHHLALLVALTLPALYLPPFAEDAVTRAAWRAAGVLGLLTLLALPHVLTSAGGAGAFDGPVFLIIVLKGHGMLVALSAAFGAHLREVRALAFRDPLTGLANRRRVGDVLETVLETALAETNRTDRPCAVLLLDLDHFKAVNDAYGHGTGDTVLREVARRLAAGLRPGDLLGRWGGEEFIVVLPVADAPAARALAERLRTDLEDAPVIGTLRLTLSAGTASSKPGDTPAALVARADGALYRAKHSGRNRTVAAEDVGQDEVL